MNHPAAQTRRGVAFLIAVILVVGLVEATLVCFGADGHVAAEAGTLDHHAVLPLTSSHVSFGTEAESHGPCVDATLPSAISGDPHAARIDDASMLTAAPEFPLTSPSRGAALDATVATSGTLAALSRSTVLRL